MWQSHFEQESHITVLLMRRRPLNKSNKIDVIHSFLASVIICGIPLQQMAWGNKLREQVTHSCAYGLVKNDKFLKCAIYLASCAFHPQDDSCHHLYEHRVTSYNQESQITKALPVSEDWKFGPLFLSTYPSRREQIDGSMRPASSSVSMSGMECKWGQGEKEMVNRE